MQTKAMRQRLDFAVGAFVLFAAVAVVFIALRAANLTSISADGGYLVKVRFDNIGSLVTRSPVKSAGVRVGRVKEINFINDEFVAEATLVIDKPYLFPIDSIFSIVSSNLLGGQYISIEPGSEEENVPENSTVHGNSAIVLEHLISKFLFDKAGE
ncbi:outer membrane lipid asymmetry maintenance protein MlaD [Candidatus Persebacteraceae bacterium Df01]|jgi:phospholipid/cholesterol/gamma-HCH transport system substrate-binding protein|uniref:Outer membrane lipid asymmetry maintenance protein MlaD n=1 Tax=Candidatus Doriopsillibacter californiensis TaxID=2970740 RepID=A0ABT7QK53_9GAMM|nr:outer membrane lipid asymmetry maintenance protein MlaD [Candidatus Persebacteraceae bacterium Df01]